MNLSNMGVANVLDWRWEAHVKTLTVGGVKMEDERQSYQLRVPGLG